jgi:hypothetical protein
MTMQTVSDFVFFKKAVGDAEQNSTVNETISEDVTVCAERLASDLCDGGLSSVSKVL